MKRREFLKNLALSFGVLGLATLRSEIPFSLIETKEEVVLDAFDLRELDNIFKQKYLKLAENLYNSPYPLFKN
jgi:hypothetical protein